MLSIVSTPIGNLEDITLRAIRTLKEADFIACEDTRTTGILLHHYAISRPLLSFHAHSSDGQTDRIIRLLKEGKHVALVSDAGTPGISDPWFVLIRDAIHANIPVVPIPGASALLSALVGSGMNTHHFLYLGFLPVKKGRKTLFEKLKEKEQTVVIYESPHRLLHTLENIQSTFGESHPIVIARELTKKFEEFRRETVAASLAHFTKTAPKGEFVICF